MKKRTILFLCALVMLAVITGCSSSKKIAYLQGSEELSAAEYAQTTPLYDARIMPKDLLTETFESTVTMVLDKPINAEHLRLTDLLTGEIYKLPDSMVDGSTLVNIPVTDSPLLLTFGDFLN